MKRLVLCALVGLAAAACQSDRIASPPNSNVATIDDALAASRDWNDTYRLPWSDEGLRVMQYNLYLGTNFGPVFTASAADLPMAIYLAYVELQQTDFPARAGRIAAQIGKVRPDLVGIEEVALWSVSPDYTLGGIPNPFVVQYDFLQLLKDSLAARGLHYAAPAVDTTSDVTVPVLTGVNGEGVPTGVLVHFQDRDAVLVRHGVRYSDPQHGVYQVAVGPLSVGGQDVFIKNGWSSVRATRDGRPFRFVVTHLNAEVGAANAGQAQELLAVVQDEHVPVILAGDFNSGPGVAADFAPTYALLTGAGFTDLWPVARPHDPGLTNGPLDGVGALDANGVLVPYPTLTFTTRVDLVLVRMPFGHPHDVHAALFGIQPFDRTAAGLWPSDHAGLGVVFELPRLLAHRDWDPDRW